MVQLVQTIAVGKESIAKAEQQCVPSDCHSMRPMAKIREFQLPFNQNALQLMKDLCGLYITATV